MTTRADLAALRTAFTDLRLERALSRLGNIIHFMNTGAHPDDEHSSFLAWLRFGRGINTSIACSTRGEGGQNIRGPERGARLGLLRTAEMEKAAAVLDADVHWLGFGLQDQVFDFGFSKSGEDTLARWGGAPVMIDRMVRLFRRVRPDIILPTFLDVPGQHGHHRAMTAAALAAWRLSCDTDYKISDLERWNISKFYLPAWSGGGATYDDELPPPPATLTVNAVGHEPLTGASWQQIGEASRLCHASQDMGDPLADGPEVWPLHRVDGPPEGDLLDGLPRGLTDLSDRYGGPAILHELEALFTEAKALRGGELVRILGHADIALATARERQSAAFAVQHGHRLDRQKAALDQAMLLATGQLPRRITTRDAVLVAGEQTDLLITPPTSAALEFRLPPGVSAQGHQLMAAPEMSAPERFCADYWALGGGTACSVRVFSNIEGRGYAAFVDLDPAPDLKPAGAEPFAQSDLILRRQAGEIAWPVALNLPLGVTLNPSLHDLTEGTARPDRRQIKPGRFALIPQRGGRQLQDWQSAGQIDGRALHLASPRVLRLLALDLALPQSRIGYLPGTDDSLPWLQAAGFTPEVVAAMTDETDLSRFDALLIGTVAFGVVPGLAQSGSRLRRFVAHGGHLVTFYQRPDQGWDSQNLPPARLEIGTPSLRWRVTDPDAPVTTLAPDHPLLNGPNRIGAEDWSGWDKERGLYFASAWDPAYVPLVAMSDPGEAPLQGGLLSGRFGAGRHSHVALTLHHQMAQLVPGAYRLMANLLQPA